MTRGSLAVAALVMVTMRCGAGHITLRGKAASEEQGIQPGTATGLERKLNWRHMDYGTDDSSGTYYGATDDSFGTTDDSFGTDLGTTDDASGTYYGTTDDDESTDSSAAPPPEPTPGTAKPQTPPTPVSTSTSAVITPAPAAPETTPPGLDAEMGMLLELHNAARCMHGASPLSWSSEVASVAQSWAEHLTSSSMCGQLEHSTSEQRNGYGENLYMCWGSSDGCYSSEEAMNGLYLEELTDGPVTEYGGHATQILWKSSAELGCAVESCSGGGDNTQVLVCNYNPPGNYNDRYEEEVEQPSKSAQSCGYP